MRASVVRRYGTPEVFEWRQVPDPQPKAGEVLIRVRAVGVNFADLLQRMGLYPKTPKPPFIPGMEIAGVVEKATDSAKAADGHPLLPGEAVTAITSFNAYAEWVAVPAHEIYRIPKGMTFEDAAAIPVNYLTAYHAMFVMGNMQPEDRILIHGAAGGVGIAAVQMARARNMKIFGTASGSKLEYLRKIGVDHPMDYEKGDVAEMVRKYAPDGIEMVMDAIGGKSFSTSYKCLGPTGRLVIYGLSASASSNGKRSILRGLKALAQTPRFHPLKLMADNISLIGVNLPKVSVRPGLLQREMDDLFRMYAEGKIKPVISKTFPSRKPLLLINTFTTGKISGR